MTAPLRKKLIEVSIPLEAINKASKKQKAPKGYPTSLHTYWAPRPLAACRAVLFAQLVDDPSAWPDRFPTELEQDAERKRLHKLITDLVPWEASNNDEILNAARWEIARSVAWGLGEEPPAAEDGPAILAYLQAKGPPVYDPFSGAGSIPLEAQRLGLRAYGSDLNPVAVLIGKALVEIPPKFSGLSPVNPASRKQWERGGSWQGRGAQGLAEDLRYYGIWMRDEAEKRIGHLYPKATLPDGSEATVIAWLWARTVRSPDPAAKGAMVPLVSSFMLSTKTGMKAWVELVIEADVRDGWRFDVKSGALSKADEERLKQGTKTGRGTHFECILTGGVISPDYVRGEGNAKGLGARLMAIVAEGKRHRVYLSPATDHEMVAASAQPIDISSVDVDMPDNPRWFSPPAYGMKTFASLFTSRQLVSLLTLSDLVSEARERILVDACAANFCNDTLSLHAGGIGAKAYADAVATYLAFVVDRAANYGSSLSTWLTDDNAIRGTFGRQALPMTWDFCEGNYFGDSSAAITTIVKTVSDVVATLNAVSFGHINQIDAPQNNYPVRPCVINVDPPYYDNIGYADLSDFFYVWLRASLLTIWPDLFRRLTTPKDQELVATPYRHGGKKEAEAFFMKGMRHALAAMHKASTDAEPLAIYYAFKQAEIAIEGITSAGWASFLQAVVDSGLSVDGTWPLRTESAGRLVGRGANALASSIVLVCRKRSINAEVVTRNDLVRALRREMPDAIDNIRKAGVGPVDMQQSVIGPGMGVFTRYARVLEDDDSTMDVKTALTLINRVWEEIENELDAAFDSATQVALAWFATYGFDAKPSGELITLANAKNIPLEALFSSGVFRNLHGRAGLIPRTELPTGWTPASDKEPTVWECVQHTARVLAAESGGAAAAAALVGQMGRMAADARTLAYRLFEIATKKGWAAEALVYNELAEEWPHLEDLAPIAATRGGAPAQAELFQELR
jgi:putative DNA methylase